MKKTFCAAVAAFMIFSLCICVFASDPMSNGGDIPVSWSYDSESGRLEITGSGKITDAPWKSEDIEPTSLVIGDGITHICRGAFADMISIEAITLPYSIESVGENAFYNTYYYNHPQNREGGVLYIGNVLIDALPNLPRSYTVKEGTRCIADYAFDGCKGLVSLTLPEGVTHIGNYALYGCTSLKRLTLPSTLAVIGSSATLYSENIESVIYKGTPDLFARIFVEHGNESLRGAEIKFLSDSESDTTTSADNEKKPAGVFGGCTEMMPGAFFTAALLAFAAAFAVIKKK